MSLRNRHRRRNHDELLSSRATDEDRRMRLNIILKQREFIDNVRSSIKDPNWPLVNHPVIQRTSAMDFLIDFELKAKQFTAGLNEELVSINAALTEGLGDDEDE